MWNFSGHASELAFPMVSRSFIGQRGANTRHRNTVKPASAHSQSHQQKMELRPSFGQETSIEKSEPRKSAWVVGDLR